MTRGVGLKTVGKYHSHQPGAGDHVEVGEDDPLVDDDDPGADAFFGFVVSVRFQFQPAHAHNRGSYGLVGLGRVRRQRFGLQRVEHRRVDVVLGDPARQRC